jgi:hypothetical protein
MDQPPGAQRDCTPLCPCGCGGHDTVLATERLADLQLDHPGISCTGAAGRYRASIAELEVCGRDMQITPRSTPLGTPEEPAPKALLVLPSNRQLLGRHDGYISGSPCTKAAAANLGTPGER